MFSLVNSKVFLVLCLPLLARSNDYTTARSACPDIVSREQWNAKPSRQHQALTENPPPWVVVHHSNTSGCDTSLSCIRRVRNIQTHHMDTNYWDDIGYNFLIGGDGQVYEGRGWGVHGAHSPRFNAKSVGVCLIGNFHDSKPSDVQLEALKGLIDCGVEGGYLEEEYHLIGHRQGRTTTCPGDALFEEIQTWPHFDRWVQVTSPWDLY